MITMPLSRRRGGWRWPILAGLSLALGAGTTAFASARQDNPLLLAVSAGPSGTAADPHGSSGKGKAVRPRRPMPRSNWGDLFKNLPTDGQDCREMGADGLLHNGRWDGKRGICAYDHNAEDKWLSHPHAKFN